MSETPAVIRDLQARALVAQSTGLPAIGAAVAAGPMTYYCGFDPTAPSLHIGNLVQLITMRRLQLAGNHPLALVGGATGLIGDPKMAGERTLNDPLVVASWVERIRAQIAPLLDFEGQFAARMVNNLDWTAPLSAIDLLRGVGKHYRMSTMLAKDTVARRLESAEGLSFTEFSYQVLQGMDFLELNRRYGCQLQTGGNDQWGNLVAGVDLIHKADAKEAHAFTTPLVTKADGSKFGKTESGTVWLDPAMTTPYAFYQFWLNQGDADVPNYLKVFTFLTLEQIDDLVAQLAANPGGRAAQKALAWEVTAMVHGQASAQGAVAASAALFGAGDLGVLDAATLAAAVAELPSAAVAGDAPTVIDALVATGLEKSRGAARRTLTSGGVYLNNVKVAESEATLGSGDFLHGQFALLRRGRKTLAVVSRN